MKRFNINNNIYFRPTKSGMEIWKQHFERHGVDEEYLFEDMLETYKFGDGIYRIQCWVFCNIFGPTMANGFANPVDTVILIEDNCLVDA